MKSDRAVPRPTEHYVVPARHLSGTRDEILAQIDEIMLGLAGLRQLVSMNGSRRAEAPRRKLRLVKGLLRVLFLSGAAFWVLPAQAQTPAPAAAPTQGAADSEGQQQAFADPWRSIKFGGTFEGYYQYNWNRPPERSLVLRAYDTRANTFGIQQTAVVVDAAPEVEAGRRYGLRVEQADNGGPGGPDGFFRVFDTYVTVAPTSALLLGFDVNYVTNEVNRRDPALSLQGIGTYARYQFTGSSAVGVRYERLDDEGLFGAIDQLLHETTSPLSASWQRASSCAPSSAATGRTNRSSPAPEAAAIRAGTRTPRSLAASG